MMLYVFGKEMAIGVWLWEYADYAESYRKLVVRELSVHSSMKQIENRKTAVGYVAPVSKFGF